MRDIGGWVEAEISESSRYAKATTDHRGVTDQAPTPTERGGDALPGPTSVKKSASGAID